MKILAEAGYVEAIDISTSGDISWKPISLTWRGHEFLDASRNATVWKKTMDFVREKGGSVPFEVLQSVLFKLAAAQLGIT